MASKEINVSDWVAEILAEQGVERVFLYPGGTIAPLVNACIKKGIVIENFKNEQGAGYAALAYARLTGRPQVIMVTSGPGVTNILTPLADAYYDSTPVIVITGQVGTTDLNGRSGVRQRGFQEVPTVAITSPISKLSVCLMSPDDVFHYVPQAFKTAMQGRRGPVVLDFPMDIQRGDIVLTHNQELTYSPSFQVDDSVKFSLQDSLLKEVAEAACAAKFPVILLGQGALTAGCFESYLKIADSIDGALVTSFLGVGAIDTDNDRSLGYIGHTGHLAANKAVHKSDFLLVLGSRLDVRQTGNQVNDFTPQGKVAWVDIDINELENPRVAVDWLIPAALEKFCDRFIEKLPEGSPEIKNQNLLEFLNLYSHRYEDIPDPESLVIQPRDLMDALDVLLKNINTTVVTGVGCHQHWVARHLSFRPNDVKHLSSGGHGAMGYDLPSAVGAAMAEPDRIILCVVGDGSILMNIQELATIKQRNLNIKIVVVNNSRLGMVSQFQLITWGSDPTTGDVDTIDFKAIGEGFGIPSVRLSQVDSMEATLNKFWLASGPSLVEVIVDSKADVVPMLLGGQRMDDMWMGRAK